MADVTNKTDRLITTHLGDQLPPGATVTVADETMDHPTMQQFVTDGYLETGAATRKAPTPPVTKA